MSSQTAISYGQRPPIKIDPDDFVRKIDNPYFPLKPGTTFFYENADKSETIEFAITRKTIKILGVTCTVVLDTVRDEDGRLIEKTFDYFAQDRQGNIWYFGEHAKNFEKGKFVDTAGSWLAGVDGAAPGIIMKAHPGIGDRYNQENAPGIAEDMGKVLKLDDTVTVPYGTFSHVLRTKDFTPLDPGVVEHKFYAKGIGTVFVVDRTTGEFEHLVKIKVVGTAHHDKLTGHIGPDELFGRSGHDKLTARGGDDLLSGSRGNDWLNGGSGDDTIKGGPGRDTLLGSSGDDTLLGGRGNDVLCGNRGADDLRGGPGTDRFVLKALTDSPTLAAGDFIRDFDQGADRMDVSAIDAVAGTSGNQAFTFIGFGAFSGTAGELRFTLDDQAGTANDRTIVQADVDGDLASDLQFALRGLINLADNDFIL